MTSLIDLYALAEKDGIGVYWFTMESAESLSYMDDDGDCYIALDPWHMPTLAAERVKLSHELGHCETGSFYNRWASHDVRQKHENRANRWAYKKLIPKDELLGAMNHGYQEPWELADYFGVPEYFIRNAMDYYQTCEEQ